METVPISVQALDRAVAAEVRAEIGRQKITVTSLAAAIGMRRATLVARTQGHIPFSPAQLATVAAQLGTTAAELVDRSEKRTEPVGA